MRGTIGAASIPGGKRHGEPDQPCHRTARAGPGDLLHRGTYRACADARTGPRRCRHLGRLHQCRHGARRLRHDRPCRIHARPGRGRAERSGHRAPAVIVEPPVNGIDEAMSSQRLAVAPDPRPAACTGCCCARRNRRTPCAPSSKAAVIRTTQGVDPALPRPLERLRGASGEPRRAARCWALVRAAAAPKRRPRHLGVSSGGLHASAAIRGRSTRRASCCSASSSKALRGWRAARRSWRCRASALPRWGRATSAYRSAISSCRATLIRRRCRRRATACFAACRKNGVAFLETGTPANIAASSTRACGLSPATARKPPASAAPTSTARCQCERKSRPRNETASFLAMTILGFVSQELHRESEATKQSGPDALGRESSPYRSGML